MPGKGLRAAGTNTLKKYPRRPALLIRVVELPALFSGKLTVWTVVFMVCGLQYTSPPGKLQEKLGRS